jgi:signal peptidase
MSPGIPAGSIVFVAPEPARALRVGQVITYQIPVEDHRVVTHRVFKIIRGGDRPVFVTKGDANNAPDAWTAQAGGPVMWRERLSVPHVGYAIWALRSHVVHRALVLGAPVLFVLFALASIWRPARAELTPA